MAGQSYLSNPNNPFFSVEDDDIDDETFLRNSRVSNSNYSNASQERARLEEKHLQLLERKKEIEDRTLQSSERSISLLRDSEQIGVATAEELLRQREQLERTEKRLDDINTTLRFSQKHIQGIKSVFGSLKNYLSGKSGEPPLAPNPKGKDQEEVESYVGSSRTNSPLTEALDHTRARPGALSPTDSHPGMRVRGLAPEPDAGASRSSTANVDQILDRNVEEMLGSLVRLKGLAHGLGEEIDSQNDLVEDIVMKTDRADISITKQNKDMNRLLKK